MCVDFTDLNKSCPKDRYLLPHIDTLIDVASGFCLLSFMDAYSGYNQIWMSLADAPKTTFVIDRNNYYYEVMPFGIKKVWGYVSEVNGYCFLITYRMKP